MIDPNAMSQGIAGAMPQIAAADPQRRPQGQVGGDLLKALAAQKLLKEKQAAQRQMALAQETDANTVVSKNEAELAQRSLDEVSKGVSGVLQNKQKNAQKRINALASGQRRGRPPQGLANARMAQAAAQQGGPRRMAQGGIVGFQQGQEVEGAEVDAETQSKIIEYVKENPWATALNTAALAALVAPVPGGRPLAGVLKLGAMGAKYAPKIAKGVGKLFTKPKPGLQGRNLNRINTGQPMGEATKRLGITDDVTAASRQFDPLRSAGVLGTAGGISSLIEGGGDEKIVDTGKGDEDKKVITPAATLPAPAVDSNLPTYQEKMTKIERALAQGGIESFAKNMQDMDEKEAERAIKERSNELLAEYNRSVVDQRTLNAAQTQLLNYSKQLQILVSQDPMVLAAQRALEAALDDGDESDIVTAQKALSSAQGAATASIGKTPSGRALISQIKALEATLSRYQGGSATVDSSGFGELKITG